MAAPLVRAQRALRSRALAVAVMVATLAIGGIVPIAAASPPARAYGNANGVHRQVAPPRHFGSLVAAANAAAPAAKVSKPVLHEPVVQASARPVQAAGASSPHPLIVPTVNVTKLSSFVGLNEAEGGSLIPADPWVAVNSSYVVQLVNSVARISNRAGTPLA